MARLFRAKLERATRVLDAWAPGYSKTLHTWSVVGGSAIGLSTGDGKVVWEYSWNGLTLVWSERWTRPPTACDCATLKPGQEST